MRANSLYRNDIPGDAAKVVAFRPRAGNKARMAALAWLASVGQRVSPRAQHVGRVLARHASVARYDVPWRHIRAGKLVSFVAITTLAREIGRNRSTVERGLTELVRVGLVKHRTFRTTTYEFPEPADLPADLLADLPADLRADPKERTEKRSDEAAEELDANPPPPIGIDDQERQRRYGERARMLVKRWRFDWYPKFRDGVNVTNPDRNRQDYVAALWLCEQFEDDDLETLCVFFLRIPDGAEPQFQRKKTRTLRWCLGCAAALSRKLKLKGRAK